MAATRSAAEVWLVGKPTEQLSTARLPSKGDVLRRLLFHHLEEHQEVKASVRATTVAVLEVWERARIPTQRIDAVERKLRKLYDEYLLLKKNRRTELESCRMKEDIFKGDLSDLFDLSSKNALEVMKNEEDKEFLLLQKEDTMSCSMAGVDKCLEAKETRKRCQESKSEARRQRSSVEMQNVTECISSTSALPESTATSSSSSGDDDDEYKPPSTPSSSTSSSSHSAKKMKKVLTEEVAASLDRVNLSDRKALFVVGTVAHALGHPLADVSVSRSTIRQTRMENREVVTSRDESFSPPDPLLLHWDAKLLPDIAGGKHKVDRVAVLVSGGGVEKLLAVPAIGRGTGEEQANACLSTLDDWKLRTQVRGLVFDTTSSNTGLNMVHVQYSSGLSVQTLCGLLAGTMFLKSCFLMFSLLHLEPVQGQIFHCSNVFRNSGHLSTEKSSHLPVMISSSLMTSGDYVTKCSCTMLMQ